MNFKQRKIKKKNKVTNAGLIAFVILLLLIMLFFSRFGILRFYLNRKIHHFNNNGHTELIIGKIGFTGIIDARCTMYDVRLINHKSVISNQYSDTLLKIDTAIFKINPLPVILGKLNLRSIFLNNIHAHFIDKEGYNNYSFFFADKQTQNVRSSHLAFGSELNNLLTAFFNKTPSFIEIRNFSALLELQKEKAVFNLKILRFEDMKIGKTTLDVVENNKSYELIMEGSINKINQQVNLLVYSNSDARVYIPYLDERYDLKLGFNKLNLQVCKNNFKGGILNLTGLISATNILLNHPKVAQNDITIDSTTIKYNINAGEDYFELDSLTEVTYNRIKFNPYIKFKVQSSKFQVKNSTSLTLILNKNRFTAQDLFESLPEGLFSNLKGIKTKGELEYHLKFSVDLSKPDSLIFFSNLVKHNFKIISFGQTDFTILNNSFLYTAYDKGKPVKSFIVGPENPEFVILKNIPADLIYSVLTSEDGGFFIHRGFNSDAFRESIIKNIKENKFARGGSTITMQLVKNVFLNRNKNVARKAEEAIIVWLLENNNLSTKERMLEVYLNIIEWGPGIYGIGEASAFYFNKKPMKLTLAECIFLANIISHPKWYKYCFDENGNLKENVKGFYKLVSEKMLRKEYITQREFEELRPEVKLKGLSLKLLMKDTLGRKVNIDSLENNYEF